MPEQITPEFLRQFDLDTRQDANGLSERGALLDLLEERGEVFAWVTEEEGIRPLVGDYGDGADCTPGVTIAFFVPGHGRLWEVKGWKVRLWHFGDWCGRQSQSQGWRWIRDDQDGCYSGRPRVELEEELEEKEILDADGDIVGYEESPLYHVTVRPGEHVGGGEDFVFRTRALAEALEEAILNAFYEWEPKDASDEEVLEAILRQRPDWTLESPTVRGGYGSDLTYSVGLHANRHACRPFFAVEDEDELFDTPEEAFDAALQSIRSRMEKWDVSNEDIDEALAALESERRAALRTLRKAAKFDEKD